MVQYVLVNDPERIISGVKNIIQDRYGIDLASIEYMPVGFVGIHFKAVDKDGRGYFLTVYDGSRLAQITTKRLSFILPAVHYLQTSGQFTDLAAPIPDLYGKLWATYKGMPVIVYPFLDGHLLAEEGNDTGKRSIELGRLVAHLHAAELASNIENPIREQFKFHFEAPLRESLAVLEDVHPGAARSTLALRDLLLPQKDKISQLFNRLYELAHSLRQISPPFVICHTDIHPWNVIRTRDGKLTIIDWEGICLAPAEHDLFGFTGSGFGTFLQAYYAAGGRHSLTAEGFAFYFYRRNLEDLTDFISRILDEDGGEARNMRDLEGIQQECMSGWPDLETAVVRMRIELKSLEP